MPSALRVSVLASVTAACLLLPTPKAWAQG